MIINTLFIKGGVWLVVLTEIRKGCFPFVANNLFTMTKKKTKLTGK